MACSVAAAGGFVAGGIMQRYRPSEVSMARRAKPDPIAAIERRHGFEVPEVYRRLHADGRLRYGRTRAEWARTWRQRTLEDPPALLGCDFEWMPPEDIARYRAPEYWTDDPPLVPFAHNGGGDVWAWAPAWATRGKLPIVFAWHDLNEASVVAPDLQGLLFRVQLEAWTELDEDQEPNFTAEEQSRARHAAVAAVAPYLRPATRRVLREVVERPVRTTTVKGRIPYEARGLLSSREARRLVREHLPHPRLDRTFEHMR